MVDGGVLCLLRKGLKRCLPPIQAAPQASLGLLEWSPLLKSQKKPTQPQDDESFPQLAHPPRGSAISQASPLGFVIVLLIGRARVAWWGLAAELLSSLVGGL